MNARTQRIRRSRLLAFAVLAAAALTAGATEARAACFSTPLQTRVGQLNLQTKSSAQVKTGIAARVTEAAQTKAGAQRGASALDRDRDNSPHFIVGMWQNVMTAFPGTPDEFVFDFGFQQFHADGTEVMTSGGVPPTIGNFCMGTWEAEPGGTIRLLHVGWNFAGNEVFGDLPTGYFFLEVALRTNSRGTTYTGRFRAASYDLGSGPLGSGGPPQPGSEFEGTVEATKIRLN
jgi:hypothetical protein